MHTPTTIHRSVKNRSLTLLGSVTLLASLTHCGGEWAQPGTDDPASAQAEQAVGAGEIRTGTFDLPGGRRRVTYRVIRGRRFTQGDIELGPSVEERAATDRTTLSAGRDDASFLWPDNVVVYADYTDLPTTTQANITAAMQHWTENTSVRFRLRTTEADFVRFRDDEPGCFSQVGHEGGEQVVNLASNCSAGATIHEIGHTVGLWHEQTRTDHSAFVNVAEECVDPDIFDENFDTFTDGVNYGLYDFDSIMHYGSGAFFLDPKPAACTSNGITLWRRSSIGTAQDGIDAQRTALSVIDRQGVEEMYSEGLGQSAVVADFNGDGFRDLALGAPRNGAGRVRVYRGTATGLVFTDELQQGLFDSQREDRFGYALAAGDFNGDGRADLAVGVPGENGRTGRVVVYRGRNSTTNLLDHLVSFDQSSLASNEGGDRFGYALSAGDVNNDGFDDLAIGAPGEGWGSGAPSAGAVFLFRGSATTLTGWRLVGQSGLGTDEAGDSFGASVLLRDLDADGRADLAVGAPIERNGSAVQGGVVFLFRGETTGVSAWRTFAPFNNLNQQDLLFGFSLTAGDVDGDGYRELFVGAPGATVGWTQWAGRVFVFRGSSTGPTSAGWKTLNAASPATGEGFGFSLVAARFNDDTRADVAIGAPGSRPSSAVASGRVHTFMGSSTGFTASTVLSQTGLGTNEAGDRLGASVAMGDFDNDGDDDLASGAPGERPPSSAQTGYGFVYRSNGASLSTWTVATP